MRVTPRSRTHDEETLHPLDNPFGTRLSPMSSVRSVTYVSGPDTALVAGRGRAWEGKFDALRKISRPWDRRCRLDARKPFP